MPEIDPHVSTWLEQDAERAEAEVPDLEGLWATLDAKVQAPGWREPFVSARTPIRMAAAVVGVVVVGVAMVGVQGLRGDLDQAGWIRFALFGATLMGIGIATALWPLRSRARAPGPLWPLIPAAWLLLLAFSTIVPWPGMTGVPAAMHAWCFGATTVGGLLATGWLALWERSVQPVPQRIGLAATGAGLTAFVFQSLFCPGVDVVHLLVGHAGPTVGLAMVTIGLALLLRR